MTDRQPVRFLDPFEAWLATGLAIEPSAAATEKIDRRVRTAIAAPGSLAQQRTRIGRRPRTLLLVAATIAIMGAGAGILGLFGTIFGPVEGWRTAFNRAEQLDVTVTSGDVRASVVRAYADANLVFIFLVSENLHDQAQPSVDGQGVLVDGGDVGYEPILASGVADQSIAAEMFVFETPEPWLDGSRSFTFTVPAFRDPRATVDDPSPDAGLLAGGPYVFEFALTSQGGHAAAAGPPASSNGTIVELRSLILSPTAARGTLAIDPVPPGERPFFRIFVRSDGRSVEVATYDRIEGSESFLMWFETVAGFDDPGRTGSVEVRRIGSDGSEIPGEDWVIPFELQ